MVLKVIDLEKLKKNPQPSGGAEWGCLKVFVFFKKIFYFGMGRQSR